MSKPRLLVVDDDPINLKTLIGLLEQEFEIAAAINGKVGLQAAERTAPDLILLDITMPDMDGYAVLNELKQRGTTRDIPVIFITGLNSAEDEAKGLEQGASDYISKPFNPTVVKARVNTQLRLKQQSDLLALSAVQDGLTKVANRQHIEAQISRTIEEAAITAESMGLLMVDIDQFKRFNQIYGNEYGDATLKILSRLLQKKLDSVREEQRPQTSSAASGAHSALGRVEGDRFLLLVRQADEKTLASLASAIKLAVADLKIPNAASKHRECLTVSQGYVAIVPDAGTTADQLLEHAKLAVSAAKRNGGNRAKAQQPSTRIYWDREPQ
jgi:diguanylate cyclase (GGDEF)-like protein